MNKLLKPPPIEDIGVLLDANRYDSVFAKCEQYVRAKVRAYLNKFPVYIQQKEDFVQELSIHLLTKTFPNPRFRQACVEESLFKAYLNRTIFNFLNTLLAKEKRSRQIVVSFTSFGIQNEAQDDSSLDKCTWIDDKAQQSLPESRQLLACLENTFTKFLHNFDFLFPKIVGKLNLLLKITARVAIVPKDLINCFPSIAAYEIDYILNKLLPEIAYIHTEDIRIYEALYPYFEKYRLESGSASSLQRWLNQQISGAKDKKGILHYVVIEEQNQRWEITDKRMFTEFLHHYFDTQIKTEEAKSYAQKQNVWQKVWSTVWVKDTQEALEMERVKG